tara:strand:+ start:152 stop:418 length:267 start_codon:yes stop_codon:yes gene_type:complete
MDDYEDETLSLPLLEENFRNSLPYYLSIIFDKGAMADLDPSYVLTVVVYKAVKIMEHQHNYDHRHLLAFIKDTLEKLTLEEIDESVAH